MRVAVEPILLACCAVEVASALHTPADIADIVWASHDEPRDVTVVVIAGTITTENKPVIEARIEATAGLRAVIAYGVCASSGGPYWDSATVVQGWTDADLFVPGCPPPDRVFWDAVAEAARGAVGRVTL